MSNFKRGWELKPSEGFDCRVINNWDDWTKKCVVYGLECRDWRIYYVGQTCNVPERLASYESGYEQRKVNEWIRCVGGFVGNIRMICLYKWTRDDGPGSSKQRKYIESVEKALIAKYGHVMYNE